MARAAAVVWFYAARTAAMPESIAHQEILHAHIRLLCCCYHHSARCSSARRRSRI